MSNKLCSRCLLVDKYAILQQLTAAVAAADAVDSWHFALELAYFIGSSLRRVVNTESLLLRLCN